MVITARRSRSGAEVKMAERRADIVVEPEELGEGSFATVLVRNLLPRLRRIQTIASWDFNFPLFTILPRLVFGCVNADFCNIITHQLTNAVFFSVFQALHFDPSTFPEFGYFSKTIARFS